MLTVGCVYNFLFHILVNLIEKLSKLVLLFILNIVELVILQIYNMNDNISLYLSLPNAVDMALGSPEVSIQYKYSVYNK